jgi:hypothetical protein
MAIVKISGKVKTMTLKEAQSLMHSGVKITVLAVCSR